jgi:hypothetical protein
MTWDGVVVESVSGEIEITATAVQAITSTIMTVVTYYLARYARATIDEGKKDCRAHIIEKRLEEVYSPLYEIMRRAKFARQNR